jgi:serine phosphatase RsbU (regulator of sigma subunit)
MSTPFSTRFVDLLDLPEQEALQLHFSNGNYKWFRAYAVTCTGVAVLFALYTLTTGEYLKLLLPAANLVLVRWLFVSGEKSLFQRQFRQFLTGYLLLQVALLVSYDPSPPEGRYILGFCVPVLLVPFSFRLVRSLVLYGLLLAAALAPDAWRLIVESELQGWTRPLLLIVVFVPCALLNLATTRRSQRAFVEQFREQSSRHRDRKRMREELNYARRIQLQMLPQGEPKIPGLDLCGICLPATEVGGDYYEYFQRGSNALGFAIGDVAGHGVASGLLLSGIRSGLHLLHPEKLQPSEILTRLNQMVRDTNDSRRFITLLYAIVDYKDHTVQLSTAGHPPLIHYSHGAHRTSEIDQGAPPLGTGLDTTYAETRLRFEEGDDLLFLTDGLYETVDGKNDLYGLDRLATVLTEHAHRESRQIREAILSDVWNFKGNAEQEDDITLVVMKAVAGAETSFSQDLTKSAPPDLAASEGPRS